MTLHGTNPDRSKVIVAAKSSIRSILEIGMIILRIDIIIHLIFVVVNSHQLFHLIHDLLHSHIIDIFGRLDKQMGRLAPADFTECRISCRVLTRDRIDHYGKLYGLLHILGLLNKLNSKIARRP